MADYNSDRTGSNIDLTLDKVDALDAKVQPTATGVDVTGTVTADGLTVGVSSNDSSVVANTASVRGTGDTGLYAGVHFETGNFGTDLVARGYSSSMGTFNFISRDGSYLNPKNRMTITQGGNVHLFEDTGTTAKMVWDASAESLNLGSTSSIYESAGGDFFIKDTNSGADVFIDSGRRIRFNANGSERMRIDSAGNVGIGTASPSATLALFDNTNPALSLSKTGDLSGGLQIGRDSTTLSAYIIQRENADLFIRTNNVERMRINSAGNVGIGTASPNYKLDVNTGSSAAYFTRTAGDNGVSAAAFAIGTTAMETRLGNSGNLTFRVGSVGTAANLQPEVARIDSSGNLLVGTTDSNPSDNSTQTSADNGFAVDSNGKIKVAQWGGDCMKLNRTGTDGNIAQFLKNGAPVGSIGVTISGGTGRSGLRMHQSTILPLTNSSLSDATESLGQSNYRFKDLYLSGGVYLGGTGAANKLDDYEEGVWTPALYCQGGGSISLSVNSAHYTKVGNVITASCYVVSVNTTGETLSGTLRIGGLPFSGKAFMQTGGLTYSNLFTFDEQDTAITGHMDGGAVFNPKIGASTTSIDASLINATTTGAMMFGVTYLATA